MSIKVIWKNNTYKFSNEKWYAIGGNNGWYLSKVTDENVIEELNKLLN